MKVCKRAFRRQQLDEVSDRADLAPWNSGAAHSGVDRKMPRPAAGFAPAFDLIGETECRSQARGSGTSKVPFEQRCEHDHVAGDPGPPQLLAFTDGRDTVPPRIQRIEGANNGLDS